MTSIAGLIEQPFAGCLLQEPATCAMRQHVVGEHQIELLLPELLEAFFCGPAGAGVEPGQLKQGHQQFANVSVVFHYEDLRPCEPVDLGIQPVREPRTFLDPDPFIPSAGRPAGASPSGSGAIRLPGGYERAKSLIAEI